MSVSLSSVVLSLNEQDKEQLQLTGFPSSALSDSIEAAPSCNFLIQAPPSCNLPVSAPPSLR